MAENPKIFSDWTPFAWTSFLWLALSFLFCLGSSQMTSWLVLLWGLSVLSMLSLTKATTAVFQAAAGNPSNNRFLIIRAFYWGTIKLACLGLFGTILLSRSWAKPSDVFVFIGGPIPLISLLLGFGTMIVVPVVGGLWWHQRDLRYAW